MEDQKALIFGLRTTANREDQVMDFVSSNATKKKLPVYSVIKAHGMRGYIFLEAASKADAEQAAFNVPYARGILPKEIGYNEIEHMLEQVKVEVDIRKNDIVEIISGPFKREQAKISRIDKTKEEVVVELLEAAVPIPITVKMDSVKVIRRDSEETEDEKEEEIVIPKAGKPISMPDVSAPEEDEEPEEKEFVMPGASNPKESAKVEKESFADKVKEIAEDIKEKVEDVVEEVEEKLHIKKEETEENTEQVEEKKEQKSEESESQEQKDTEENKDSKKEETSEQKPAE